MGPNGDAHAVNAQPKREIHGERRDIPERREDRKDMNERRNAEIKGVHDRRDHVDKRDSVERKVSDIKRETAIGKDQEGKNIHRKDGERKEFIPGKDPHRQKHERNFLDAVIGRDSADSHSSIHEKQESKPFQGERNDSSVHNTGHIPRTSQANQNVKSENLKSDTPSVKTETHASDQTSAKPEFVVPKLEKHETHPHRKEPVNSSTSSSNAAPKKVPVSLNLPPGVENRQSGLHKSKSEMTLNYKDYLQRKERERQQLLEKQEKFNLNKSYTEGSQSSSKTNKHPNLDTSLPVKLQGNSEKVKQEMHTENRHGVSMKPGHEKETRIRSDSETKMHHGAEAKPRKRSNSKSPGASKRSPRVHNTNSSKISPVKSSTDQSRGQVHMKSNKTETPHLKLQISNSENPPSPLKSPVKNIKEIPKSEPFVDLGEPLKTDGKKRRFSGPEIEKLTGIELENLKVKTDTTQHESVNNSASKENLKASQEAKISETKDIIKDSAKITMKQDPSEANVRDSISKIKQEPDETARLSPLVQNKHPLKDVNVAKHSPLLHDKHTPKDASIAKNSPGLHNKHPLKDSSDAKQSPTLHNRHPPKDLNLVKQSPLVSSKPEHREMDRAKHSPVVAKRDIKDSISQQSPLVTVKQEKHSPLVPKKDFKESLSAKQSPVITVQQENRDSLSARQSPLTVTKSESPRIVVKPELKDSNISKQSPRVVVKQEVTENNIDEPDIQLKPEHSGLQPLKLHIKDPPIDTHDIMASKSSTPDVSASKTASPIPSLKISIKKEPGSGGNTPVKYKTEHSNGNTPLKLTIKQEPSIENPLKMKLKASHTGDEHRHDKHHRRHKEGHVHSGKHKHKHKSHKHKDREKDRERKHSKHSVEVTGSNGKPEIKIRMKLGQPPGAEGSSASTSQSGAYHISKHDKHKRREGAHVVPEIVSNSDDPERHQPWSVSELDPKSAAKQAAKVADSPSRKRRRAPTVDDGNDISMSQPHQKAAKMTSNRLRRSSSSHSIVSMEMSDNECGEDPDKANKEQLKALQIKLTQAIQFQKKVIDDRLKEQNVTGQKPVQPNYERQKSGFDLDLYCGDTVGTPPPLPQGNPPLPPTPPSSQTLSTPPPPPPL